MIIGYSGNNNNNSFAIGEGKGKGKKFIKANIEVFVPEDFEPGLCAQCPLGSHSSLQRPLYNSCFLGYIPKECPIRVKGEENV